MLLAEVHNPTGLKLTKSDTEGIFLHFEESDDKQVGIRLDDPNMVGSSVATKWAERQFGRKDVQADLLEACKKVLQYKKWAEEGHTQDENAHEYWESVMSYVEAAIEALS